MKKLLILIYLTFTITSFANAQYIYDNTGSNIARVSDSQYYNANGSLIGKTNGEFVYDRTGSNIGRIDDNYLYNGSGSLRQSGLSTATFINTSRTFEMSSLYATPTSISILLIG